MYARTLIFTLVVALFSSIGISAQAQQKRIIIHKSADYFGHDYKRLKRVPLEQCKSACLSDSQCKAFTYNERARWCFLKNKVGELKRFKGATAGQVVGADKPNVAKLEPPARLKFLRTSQYDQALRFRKVVIERHGKKAVSDTEFLELARNAEQAGRLRQASFHYEQSVGVNPQSFSNWLGLARTALTAQPVNNTQKRDFPIVGVHAALMAHSLSTDVAGRAEALGWLARALERRNQYRASLQAYKASLALAPSPQLQAALEKLRITRGFRVLKHTVDSDSTSPRICVQFSENLLKDFDYASYLTVDGKAPASLDVEQRQLCVGGVVHGGRYRVTLRAGLQSVYKDEPLRNAVPLNVFVRDRSPFVRFAGNSFVLPRVGAKGIPIHSVNADKARVSIYRVGSGALNAAISSDKFLKALDKYGLEEIEEKFGTKVWSGIIDMRVDLNKEVITNFPVGDVLKTRKPGAYVLVATAFDDKSEDWENKATQWFVVSDIGLATQTGNDGLHIFTRSLSTAAPMGGVDVALYSHSGELLGKTVTDKTGYARLGAGLVRGKASQAPGLVMARRGNDDFVLVDLRKTAIDLSDRGVTGRTPPGPLDAFVYLERGIYRRGDIMHITALLRDDNARAVNGIPLTIKLKRPDGKIQVSRVVDARGAGGYSYSHQLQANAMLGTWKLQVFVDPKGDALVEKQVLVEDFIPDRIEFDLKTDAKSINRTGETVFTVDGRYLYGAPAGGLDLEGKIRFVPTLAMEAFKGYIFGLDDQKPKATGEVLGAIEATNEKGQSRFTVSSDLLPDNPGLFRARITVQMSENGGRAVERSISLPVAQSGTLIGIKPLFEGGAVPEGDSARFEVIAVGPDGKVRPLSGLNWKLIKMERHYQWYKGDYGWNYEPVLSTKKVSAGTLEITGDSPAKISAPVKWGRYRLEISQGETGPRSSVTFNAGWYVDATSTETPDGLEIALDKETYKPGETARVQISPRFAGKALITVGAQTLLWKKDVDVPAGGTAIDIPVGAEWGAGAYVNVTLFRPGNIAEERMPSRAIGIKWLKVDAPERTLEVKLDTPQQVKPRKPFNVPVSVAGTKAGEKVFVTVAAVDVGILNLTRYKPPQPGKWYYGQRKLGLELHDIYGNLIDGYRGIVGRIRSGGDEAGGLSAKGSPPTQKLVAFYSGIVEVGADGKANVTFDMPQFNGTVRVMAVAWSANAVGSATTDVIVRDPIVLTTTLARFLSPGDRTLMRVEIANTDGPAGDYQLAVETHGKLVADLPVSGMTVSLEKGGRKAVAIPVHGLEAGKGVLVVRLSNAGGLFVDQALDVPVRAPQLPVSQRRIVKLAANGGQLTLDKDFLAGFMPATTSVAVGVSRAAGLDVPSLLLSLDRYPYGCAEQTTSRALPLLYLSEVASRTGLGDDPAIRKRVQKAISRVLGYQASAGSFGMWSPGSDNLWLDAYVTDFLTRAREKGYSVPVDAMTAALDNLQNSLSYDVNIASKGNEIAYALYVLARNKRASIGDLRYYVNSKLDEFKSPLAKAQLAASLGFYGDRKTSEFAFRAAYKAATAAGDGIVRDDYGTPLRDQAAILALAAESRPAMNFVSEMVQLVAQRRLGKRYTSTQEKAWLLLAARALYADNNKITLEVDGLVHKGNLSRNLTGADLTTGFKVANTSGENLEAAITVTGVSRKPLPAGGEGFKISRTYYNQAGEKVDPSKVAQNERLVVVLKIIEENSWGSRIVVNDLLPAGFEIDNPRLVSSAELGNFKWLERTTAAYTAFHKDRFVAAFNRKSSDAREITLAYVVRAVSPGDYVHPAAVVEDMYRPHLSARTAQGSVQVIGPKP